MMNDDSPLGPSHSSSDARGGSHSTSPAPSPAPCAACHAVGRRSRREYLGTWLSRIAGTAAPIAFRLGMFFLSSVAGLWAFLTLRFSIPSAVCRDRSRLIVGRLSEFNTEGVYTHLRDSHGIWLVCIRATGQRRLMAYRATCTHLGCLTMWSQADNEFHCPCHGSAFDLSGNNLRGPAPRPLDVCTLRILDDDLVEVNTARTFRRGPGRALPPDSYIVL